MKWRMMKLQDERHARAQITAREGICVSPSARMPLAINFWEIPSLVGLLVLGLRELLLRLRDDAARALLAREELLELGLLLRVVALRLVEEREDVAQLEVGGPELEGALEIVDRHVERRGEL